MNLPNGFKAYRIKGASLRWRVKNPYGTEISQGKTREEAIANAMAFIKGLANAN